MVWARFDDNWTDRSDVAGLTYEQRWHLIGMIVYCCRNQLWHGELRAADARRASDVDDPAAALAALVTAGVIEPCDIGYRIVGIENHVPSEAVRDKREHDRLSKRRRRAHAKGDHVHCDESNCDVVAASSSSRIEPVVEVPVPVPVPVPGSTTDNHADCPGDSTTDKVDDDWSPSPFKAVLGK